MAKLSDAVFNPRPYMEMAIEEMHKSQNEPRPDGKVPPLVGAVILMSNGNVYGAYRGELREGDHAEYTLIERKLTNVKLDGAILFTTWSLVSNAIRQQYLVAVVHPMPGLVKFM